MKHTSNRVLLFLSLAILLTGCSARRHSMATGFSVSPTRTAVALLPSANRAGPLACTLKMSAAIDAEEVSLKGKMRVKEGEGVQISATAMGLMEAACFEFLPHSVRLIYKLDKIYADAPYAGVPFFAATGIGYNILESVILNRIFSPDATPLETALSGMTIAEEGNYVTVRTSPSHPVVYKFYIEKRSGNLVKSVGSYINSGTVVCNYSDFSTLDGKPFPQLVELLFCGSQASATLTLILSNMSSKEFKFSPRRVSNAYDRVTFESIIGAIDTSME